MKVSCQACGAKYTIADDKVRGRKVKIRCKSCGTPIVVDGQSEAPPAPAAGAPAAELGAATAAPKVPAISWSVNLSDTDQRTMSTEEIIAAWKSGEVTNDAFVWKDGMGDWVPILESAELAPLLSAGAAAPNPQDGTPFGPTVVTAPVQSARLSGGGRGGGVDLFDANANAHGPDEEEVATSAPALPTAGSTAYDDGKMTGARNENSVLFSLDSLKGGLTAEPKKPPPARKAPTTAAGSDPFAMSPADIGGGNALFSLNTNQALLTAPAAPEPPPPRLDASGAPVGKPMNKAVVYGGGALAAVVLLGLGLMLGRSGSKEGVAPEGSAKVATADSAEPEKKSEPKEAEKEKEKEKEPEKAPEAAASASASPAPTAATTAPKVASTGGSKTPPAAATPKEPKTPATPATQMPSTTDAPFSVSAAQVALTQAASNAAGCAKADGPTGSGKVQVTFATSGRVTTANVSGPPFGGTSVGGCVAGIFRKARIPAFSGNPVTVSKSFNIH
jgi:predicted Zn finger-like uncharacterized protein